jgi:hypothetical protein
MIIINTIDEQTFSLNGINYAKNFIAIKAGSNSLMINNLYDTRFNLLQSTHYSEIKVNGIFYPNVNLLMNGLTSVLYYSKNIPDIPYGGSIEPNSPAPTATTATFWTALQAGTYVNFGGLVVNPNSYATISMSSGGTFSISQTPVDFSDYSLNGNNNDNLSIENLNYFYPQKTTILDFPLVNPFNGLFYSDPAMMVKQGENDFSIAVYSIKKTDITVGLINFSGGSLYASASITILKGWNVIKYRTLFPSYEIIQDLFIGVMDIVGGSLLYKLSNNNASGLQFDSTSLIKEVSFGSFKIGLIKYNKPNDSVFFNEKNKLLIPHYQNNSGLDYSYVTTNFEINSSNRLESVYVYGLVEGGEFYIDFYSFDNGLNDTTSSITKLSLPNDNKFVLKLGWNKFDIKDIKLPIFDGNAYIALRSAAGVIGFVDRLSDSKIKTWEINISSGMATEANYLISYFIKTSNFDIESLISNNTYIELPKGQINVTSQLVMNDYSTLVGKGKDVTILVNKISTPNSTVLQVNNNCSVSNFSLIGKTTGINKNLNLFNTLSQIQSQTGLGDDGGIYVAGISSLIKDINIFNCGFAGMTIAPTSFTRTDRNNINSIQINNCFYGFNFLPSGEYGNYFGLGASQNVIGIRQSTGNLFFSSSMFNDNRIGLYMYKSTNDSHGSFAACQFNHSTNWSMVLDNITYGETFVGCHVFDGAIYLYNSTGFNFNGGSIDADILIEGGHKQLVQGTSFLNSYWDRSSNVKHNYNGITSNLSMKNNFFMFENGENDYIINN